MFICPRLASTVCFAFRNEALACRRPSYDMAKSAAETAG